MPDDLPQASLIETGEFTPESAAVSTKRITNKTLTAEQRAVVTELRQRHIDQLRKEGDFIVAASHDILD